MGYFDELWAQTVDPKRPVKRINLGFGNLMPEEFATIDLFSDIEADERERDLAPRRAGRERQIRQERAG